MQFFSKVFSTETNSSYSLSTACFSVEVNPLDRDNYMSAVEVAELGALTVALVHNHSCIAIRKAEEAPSAAATRFSIMYVADGEMMIAHHHGTTTLKSGQFFLLDNTHERKMFVYKSVKLLLVCVQRSLLQRYIPVPEDVLAQVMPASRGDSEASIFAPLLALWSHLKQGELEEFSESISEELLKDISSVFAQNDSLRQRSRHTLRLTMRVREHIEANLGDSSLSSESIASQFRISSRYLRSLFQGGERLTQYIQRRRIEESARLLASPQHRASSITDIAYRCGFNSSTHFARCFRSQFEETAREFRHRHLSMQGDEAPAASVRRVRH